MSFTDLWRCKRCNELPEILFRGKNFLIKCQTCNSRRAEVFANSLDEVVVRWNKKNNPIKTSMFGGLAALPRRLKDFFEYQFTRTTFTPAPPAEPARDLAEDAGGRSGGAKTEAVDPSVDSLDTSSSRNPPVAD